MSSQMLLFPMRNNLRESNAKKSVALRVAVLGGKLSRHFHRPVKHFNGGGLFVCKSLLPMLVRCADERSEERMRLERFRFEFGMELASDEVRMVRQFDHLDVSSIGR